MKDWEKQRKAWHHPQTFREAKHGSAELRLFTVDKFGGMMAALKGGNYRAGDTTMQLLVNGQLWMSDSRDEYRDHITAINKATGRVLIHGLGLGC